MLPRESVSGSDDEQERREERDDSDLESEDGRRDADVRMFLHFSVD